MHKISNPAELPLALSSKPIEYILELSGTPVAVADANSRSAGNGPLSAATKLQLEQQLKAAQAPVEQAVRQLGGTVTTSFQGVYNGIGVLIPARDAWKLQNLKGVTGVFRTRIFHLDTSTPPGDGIPLTGAPQAWDSGLTGSGMKIGDIDTGIDYTHADFGGSGNTADWTCALANSTADPSTVDCPGGNLSQWFGPDAPKVKGGTDLVGNCYDANGGQYVNPSLGIDCSSTDPYTPQPDPNPLDCNSHGTHTAGTAAGFGVLSDGSTYSGPYDANTISDNTWNVPPGMAPNADIYAIRVFGCSGSVNDDVLIEAMDWAYTNGMDVVNMSLGAPFGSPTDPDSVAASNLAADGVIVVSASGNNGNGPYITSSPGAGINGLAAAANDSTETFPAANLALSTGHTLTAINANGYDFTPGTYNVKVIYSSPGVISLGCSVAADGGADSVAADTIIVVARGTCARVAKAIFGQEAGAAGVIMVNNSNSYPPYEGKITSDPDNGFQYTVTIPFFGVKGGSNPSASTNGQYLIAADGGTLTDSATTIANPNFTGLASFSSWGPATGGLLKPDVTAPGVSIASAGMGTGTEALIDSGTSMATPHTAGLALLVKEAHPSWGTSFSGPFQGSTPTGIPDGTQLWKDAIVNTASAAGVLSYKTRGAGAGMIDAYNATHTQVVATGYPQGTASLSFGLPNVKTDYSATEPVVIRNLGSQVATFNLSDTRDQGYAHTVSFKIHNTPVTQVTIAAHGTKTVFVTLSVPLASSVDPIDQWYDWYLGGQFDNIAGLVAFTPAGESDNSGIPLAVPYNVVSTAASSMKVKLNTGLLQKNGTAPALISNVGAGSWGETDWFSWGGASPVSGSDIGAADLRAAGIQTFTGDGAAVLALKVNKPWTNAAADEFDFLIDVNGDGIPDYDVFTYDYGALVAGSADGIPVEFVYGFNSGDLYALYDTFAPFNATTLEMYLPWDALCLPGSESGTDPCVYDGDMTIGYSVLAFDRNGGADAIWGARPYNLVSPPFSIAGGSYYEQLDAGASTSDPLSLNPDAWAANPQLGFLVLAQNNRAKGNADEAFAIPFDPGFRRAP